MVISHHYDLLEGVVSHSYQECGSQGTMKFIHISVLVISIVLSLIPVAAALGNGGYTITLIYLSLCQPRNLDVLFYALILPFCINQPAGSTFNLLTLYKVLSLKKQLINKVASLE